MTFSQFVVAHYIALIVGAWFIFTSAVNALPAAGTTFVFGTWFMAFLRELAQQAPTKFPILTATEMKTVMLSRAKEANDASIELSK
jgi:hypothetical protein